MYAMLIKSVVHSIARSPVLGVMGMGASAVSYEAETEALVARFDVAPTDALKTLINTTIKGLKDDGVFALGDCLYIRGLHTSTSALQNWIKNAHNSTLVNSPTFTAKVGFKGNGTTQYINNNFNPKQQGSQFAYNDATMVWMQHTLSTSTGRHILGAQDNVVPQYKAYLLYYTTGNDRMYFQSGTYNGNVNCEADKQIGYTRIAGSLQGYVDGYASGAATAGVLEGDLIDLNMYELCQNMNGSPDSYQNGDIMFSFYGKGLTPTQMLALYTRVKYYYDNVGVTF